MCNFPPPSSPPHPPLIFPWTTCGHDDTKVLSACSLLSPRASWRGWSLWKMCNFLWQHGGLTKQHGAGCLMIPCQGHAASPDCTESEGGGGSKFVFWFFVIDIQRWVKQSNGRWANYYIGFRIEIGGNVGLVSLAASPWYLSKRVFWTFFLLRIAINDRKRKSSAYCCCVLAWNMLKKVFHKVKSLAKKWRAENWFWRMIEIHRMQSLFTLSLSLKFLFFPLVFLNIFFLSLKLLLFTFFLLSLSLSLALKYLFSLYFSSLSPSLFSLSLSLYTIH